MHKTLLPDGWPRPKGYANGIVAHGDSIIFCGGQIGWTSDEQFEHHDFVGQVRQALENVVAVLASAGAGPEEQLRLTRHPAASAALAAPTASAALAAPAALATPSAQPLSAPVKPRRRTGADTKLKPSATPL